MIKTHSLINGWIFSFLISLGLIFGSCSEAGKKVKLDQPPNIVFILADDLGWADLPAYGNPFNEAPNIDKLARQGMKFTNAYAASPVCSSTRASIQSGQYPSRVGIIDFLPGHWRPYEKLTPPTNRTQYLPLDVITIGEALKETGYRTGYFGKWHLGRTEKYHPKNQGYDEATIFHGGPYYNFGDRLRPQQKIKPGVRLSEKLTDMSIDFMEQNRDKPFFLTLSHYDVHVQLDADTSLIKKYLEKEKVPGYPSNAIYAAMIEHLDRSVRRIMEKLDSLALSKNTLVVFFSDNGGLIKRFDEIPLIAKAKRNYYKGDTLQYIASSNHPLRAEKGTVYEGGIREPMIVKWPGQIEAGSQSGALISSIDLYPTFMDIAGAEIPVGQIIDGKSFMPQLEGQPPNEDRDLYWHYPVYHHEVPMGAVRKGKWKLVENFQSDHTALYNLENDIGEQHDLSERYPKKRDQLLSFIEEWRKNVGARMPAVNQDFNPEERYKWVRHPDFEQMLNPE